MAIFTLIAHPAEKSACGRFTTIEITNTLKRERVEVLKLPDCEAAFAKFVADMAEHFPTGGYQASGYVFDGDGRKPTGYKPAQEAKKFELFVAAKGA